jgi:hypothetical protein
MNTPWIIGILVAIVFFAIFEARAFRFPDQQNTLSRFIYNLGSNWPLSIYLMGNFTGGLAVHFFWHWCPAGSISTGWLLDPNGNPLVALVSP